MASAAALGAVGRGFKSLCSDFISQSQDQLMDQAIFSTIYWDPNRTAFHIPFCNIEVFWYNIFFAVGFFGAYALFILLFLCYLHRTQKSTDEKTLRQTALHTADQFAWYIFLGIFIGARLGEVLFYDPQYYFSHPLKVFAVWEGGLASHGGAIGMLVAFFLFWKKHAELSKLISMQGFLDILCIVSPFTAAFIRIGNFFNQEIIGTPTSVFWAVQFGSPMDGQRLVPSHPVQLYESLFYFLLLGYLLYVYIKKENIPPGRVSGLFFTILFSFRFLIEFIKLPQGAFDTATGILSTGQMLSIPFILFGIYLLFSRRKS